MFILFSVGVLPGCWDFQEVDKLGFATTIGIDRGPENTINMSVQFPITQAALPAVISGGKETKKFLVISQTGNSVTNALDHMETKAYRSIVLNQTKSVIAGEEIARRDIKSVLDLFIRTTQMPLPAYIFVTDGITAEDVLTMEPLQNMLPGIMFIYSGQSITKYDMTYYIPHWEFQQKLVHKSKDPYAPLISIDKEHRLYVIAGLAVFNKNKMTGKLSSEETEIFGLITGIQKSGLMALPIPGGTLNLRNVSGKSKITVDIKQGRPVFKIETAVYCAVTEIVPTKLTISPQDIAGYQKIAAQNIKRRLIDLVKKLQGYNSDIIDFGEEFRVQHQNVWKKTNWKAMFPKVPFTGKVKVHIDADGRFR
jgi:spore germination protein KC